MNFLVGLVFYERALKCCTAISLKRMKQLPGITKAVQVIIKIETTFIKSSLPLFDKLNFWFTF